MNPEQMNQLFSYLSEKGDLVWPMLLQHQAVTQIGKLVLAFLWIIGGFFVAKQILRHLKNIEMDIVEKGLIYLVGFAAMFFVVLFLTIVGECILHFLYPKYYIIRDLIGVVK